MPIRIYRYVFTEVFLPFLGGFFFFTFIFLMFQVVKLADYFIKHGVSLLLLGKMTVYISAAFLPVVIPISFLVATLMGFGRLSADSEVVACKAAGISLYRLYIPIFGLSLGVCAMVFYLTYYFIPWGNWELKRTIVKLGNTKVVSALKEGTFTEGFFDLLFYAEKVDSDANRLKGVFIYDERDKKNPMTILSKEGSLTPLKTGSELSAATILKLDDGSIHRSELARRYYEKIDFNEYRLLLKVEEGRTDEVSYPKTLRSSVLLDLMEKHKGDYSRYQEYATEYWKRIALAIAPLLLGMLGVGLGVVRMRSVKSHALFVAVSVLAVYWGMHVMGASLSERGILPPWFAMQLPNIVVLPLSILSFRRSAW